MSGPLPFTVAELAAAASSPNPELFYLQRASMAQLADAIIVTEGGRELLVHSHFLIAVSPVLEAAFASQAEGGQAEEKPAHIMLCTPFCCFSIEVALAFLRLEVYCANDATDAALAEVLELLPQLLHLSHCLDTQRLFDKLLSYVNGPAFLKVLPAVSPAALGALLEAADQIKASNLLEPLMEHFQQADAVSKEQLMSWIRVAEKCELAMALHLGVGRLALYMLAEERFAFGSAHSVVRQLGPLALAQLLTYLASGPVLRKFVAARDFTGMRPGFFFGQGPKGLG
ncbi:hypothetical protein ABPG75_000094 [Micractinium tetrahymenae]